MTTLIKKASVNLFENTRNIANRICSNGDVCESIGMYFLTAAVFSIMWLSIAQM